MEESKEDTVKTEFTIMMLNNYFKQNKMLID